MPKPRDENGKVPETLLTMQEVADILKCSLPTVRRHIYVENLAMVRLGYRCIRVRPEAVRDFMLRAERGELNSTKF